MQRNIRNEIYMALGALVLISFALVFAVLLSSSIQEGESTATPATEIASSSETLEAAELVSPTDTPQIIIIESDTETPTEAPLIDTESNTPAAETVESASATLIRLDNTTSAPSPSDTEAANTVSPTLTLIRLDTALAPVTRDASQPDKTASATAITGVIPTLPPSPTVASPDEPTRTPASCQKPQGWTTYTVQAGNTLFAIALATKSTVDELRYVNCIQNIDNIIVGQVLFVPQKPRQPIKTLAPAKNHNHLYVIGCADARTKITNLQVAQTMNSTFNVYGSAFRDDFWYYKIEIRPDWASVYNFFSRSEAPVQNGVLTTINPKVFGAGVYWIRLSVVNRAANIESDAVCEIPVIFG